MSAIEPAGEKAIQRLHEAVEQLRDDIARVEIWADALDCFARPVPDYDPLESNLNKFALPAGQRKPPKNAAQNTSGEAPNQDPKSRDFQG